MTTGYRYMTWQDGGSAPGRCGNNAGDMLTILDYIFTSGDSPWTAATVSTNVKSYTAPGGSQVKVTFYDNNTMATSYLTEMEMQVGAGPVIPSVTQKANGSIGRCFIRKGWGSTLGVGWWAIRTDRLCIITCATSTSTSVGSWTVVIGDCPVLDPDDPGLCVLLGFPTNKTTAATSTTVNYSWLADNTPTPLAGYASVSRDGISSGVSCYAVIPIRTITNSGVDIAHFGGKVQLWPIYLATNPTTTHSATVFVVRGFIPFLRSLALGVTFSGLDVAFYTSTTGGDLSYDAFDVDGISYMPFASQNNTIHAFAMMLEDGEALP